MEFEYTEGYVVRGVGASMNACGDDLVKFKNDQRAGGLLRTHPEKNKDTRCGRGGSTPLQPQLVYRMGGKCEERTQCL